MLNPNQPKNLKPLIYYQKELRKVLPKEIYKPVPSRLIWFFIHEIVIVLSVWFIMTRDYVLFNILLSFIIGNSLASLGFLGHEIIHGTVVKSKRLIVLFGTLSMWHWGLHAKAWLKWHNFEHHNNTQHPFDDPDCFGRIEMYVGNSKLMFLERLIPGSKTMISFLFLFWYFSFQTAWVVFDNLKASNKTSIEAFLFLILINLGWPILTMFTIPWGWVYLWLLPLCISNFIFMSYIVTNHFLNPLTSSTNDPLVNSLTVRSNILIEKIHLNNCYHTEHHVLPFVNPKYAPLISAKIKELWPDKYCEMSHLKALKMVYKVPKVYFNDITHIDLKTKYKTKNIFSSRWDQEDEPK